MKQTNETKNYLESLLFFVDRENQKSEIEVIKVIEKYMDIDQNNKYGMCFVSFFYFHFINLYIFLPAKILFWKQLVYLYLFISEQFLLASTIDNESVTVLSLSLYIDSQLRNLKSHPQWQSPIYQNDAEYKDFHRSFFHRYHHGLTICTNMQYLAWPKVGRRAMIDCWLGYIW
jgi:hypothetical protein